ncbi:alpha/beta hydrolase family esterase [Sagittula sp. S175]|uniref:extracellular catalytic domain type 1 short-chain-length polyhydroxyalkanoate depolymerase n=1 Tax=Sagittula sp. S175 TaxID=3415129 RepID=UPI003C7E3E3C
MPLLRLLCALLLLPTTALALEEITDFGPNPGALRMFLHTPPGDATGLPLVVALHGCTLKADRFDDETGLTRLADETPFLLLLPEQDPDNMSNRCFRFYDTDDNQPGQGESASIMAMIDHVLATQGADPAKVHVLGLSGGGGMSAVMLANHPDRFAGGAIIAGVPYGCNRPASLWDTAWYWKNWFGLDGLDAIYACGIYGYSRTDRSPDTWASYITEVGSSPAQWPLLSIWQGADDDTVDPRNLTELTEQWTTVMGLAASPASTDTIGAATRRTYTDTSGTPRLETWELSGFGHAVPIDPDTGCGLMAEHMSDVDICAIRRITAFWGLD